MRNGITFFLIRKIVMQNRLSLYLDRKRIMRKGKTIFLIWKMVMKNDIFGISVEAYCIRPLKTSPKRNV
ncbi:hypothetical protein T230_10955 [Tannerella sp. oral taxon BU063 isolate Cell 1/3]|uniref:Uncharacterized protein n=1 Tax=Tannerella sp. oral taxon BU063 isolate Cell 1/3 TaxID=1411022 RepID=W2CHL6_9BACT|nr:hypothetical protein T230_10955 [Tannerella sp. oral taxon BU063 isolate Cell 1/3]